MITLLAKPVMGRRLVARKSSQPLYRPPATAEAAYVAIYEHNVGEAAEAARLVGIYARKQIGSVPFTPAGDQPKILRMISYAADGTPDFERISDAPSVTVMFTKEPDHYATNFGDGAATEFTITHNLESEDLFVCFRLASGTKESVSDIAWKPDPDDPENAIIITTTVVPTANQLRVVIKK